MNYCTENLLLQFSKENMFLNFIKLILMNEYSIVSSGQSFRTGRAIFRYPNGGLRFMQFISCNC